MNTQLSYRISITVFVAILLSLFTAACAPSQTAQVDYSQPPQPAIEPPAGDPPEPAIAPENAVAIQSLAVQSTARIFTIAEVYQLPDAASEVTRLIMPGNSVTVLGLNSDGTYFAINTGGAAGQVTGWIAAKDLSYAKISTRASSLAKVYSMPEKSDAASILIPGQPVSLLGTSPDGAWSAIATNRYDPKLTGWVRTSELSLARPSGTMLYLTKTRLTADESSQVYDILTPTQKVALLGRTRDGSWIAVASLDGITFRGWVKASDVKVSAGEQPLTVLQTH